MTKFCASCQTNKVTGRYDICSTCYAAWHASPNSPPSSSATTTAAASTAPTSTTAADATAASTAPTSTTTAAAASPKADEKASKKWWGKSKTPVLWNSVTDPEKIPHEEDDNCAICLCPLRADPNDPDDEQMPVVQLTKCSHFFHEDCISHCVNKNALKCPICSTVNGLLTGTQPAGTMHVSTSSSSLPGYPGCGTITVNYHFPDGIQGKEHPHPGMHYSGTSRTGLFPNNAEGKKVVKLLELAWKQRVIFTVGRSMTTGSDNCVIWNGIHHKTSVSGGPTNHGYPDPTYLNRVQEELASFGITEDYL